MLVTVEGDYNTEYNFNAVRVNIVPVDRYLFIDAIFWCRIDYD